jgi:putative transposase
MSDNMNWGLGEQLSLFEGGIWKTWTVNERKADGINISDVEGRQRFLSESEIRKMFMGGTFARSTPRGKMSESKQKKLETCICAMPKPERAEARRICAYVSEWVLRGKKGRATQSHLVEIINFVSKEIADAKPYSWRTLSKMLRLVKDDGSFDVREMMGDRSSRGNRTARFGNFEAIMLPAIREKMLTPQPMTTKALLRELRDALSEYNEKLDDKDRIKRKLHIRTVQRRIAEISTYDKLAAWEGAEHALKRRGAVGAAPPARYPMDVIEFDHKFMDIEVVHPETLQALGSPILTVGLDRYSRLPVGWHIGFEDPGYGPVMQCMRSVLLPKDEMLKNYGIRPDEYAYAGLFQTAMMDNGRDFRGSCLDDALAQFGISKRFARTGRGSDKGAIERFFRTVKEDFILQLPGAKLEDRGTEAHYDAQKEAKLNIAELRCLFARWVVREYAKAWHLGIKGSPLEMFREGTSKHAVRLPNNIDDVNVFLLPAESRTLQRRGIEMFGVPYGERHPELAALLMDNDKPYKCVIKFDPDDLGSIYLLDWRTQKYIKLDCPTDSGYAGRTRREFDVDCEILKAKRQKHETLYAEDLDKAGRERISAINEIKKQRKLRGRKAARMSDADPEFPSTSNHKKADTPAFARLGGLRLPPPVRGHYATRFDTFNQ